MKAIFLDRDGVINKYPGDFKYVTRWQEFHFLPYVKQAIKKLNKAGYKVFVISNQAGVSKGVYSKKVLDKITHNMLREIEKTGGHINGVYYCLHQEKDKCLCRKPKTGLIDKVLAKYQDNHLDFSNSYFIGDTIRDIQTGKSAGLKTILVFSGKEKPKNKHTWKVLPDFTARDLSEAVADILKK